MAAAQEDKDSLAAELADQGPIKPEEMALRILVVVELAVAQRRLLLHLEAEAVPEAM